MNKRGKRLVNLDMPSPISPHLSSENASVWLVRDVVKAAEGGVAFSQWPKSVLPTQVLSLPTRSTKAPPRKRVSAAFYQVRQDGKERHRGARGARDLQTEAEARMRKALQAETTVARKQIAHMQKINDLRLAAMAKARKGDASASLNIDANKHLVDLKALAKKNEKFLRDPKKVPGVQLRNGRSPKVHQPAGGAPDAGQRTDVETRRILCNLTAELQNGLKSLTNLYDASERSQLREHKRHVATLLKDYHASLLSTIEQIRAFRKSEGKLRRRSSRRKRARVKSHHELRLLHELDNLEMKRRSLANENESLKTQLIRKEDRARELLATDEAEMAAHAQRLMTANENVDKLVSESRRLVAREKRLRTELRDTQIAVRSSHAKMAMKQKLLQQRYGVTFSSNETLQKTVEPAIENEPAPSDIRQPTEMGGIRRLLQDMLVQAQMIESIMSCITCACCFKTAYPNYIEWRTGTLLCKKCVDEQLNTLQMATRNDGSATENVGKSYPKHQRLSMLARTLARLKKSRNWRGRHGRPSRLVSNFLRILDSGFGSDLGRPPQPDFTTRRVPSAGPSRPATVNRNTATEKVNLVATVPNTPVEALELEGWD